MSAAGILKFIQHYQRSIEHSHDDEVRLLHCINKLYKLPVKVEHLQETGVGKTVNSLRKFNGEIGVAAKALVTKWKAMVAAEEEPMETNYQNGNVDHSLNVTDRRSSDEDHQDNNRNSVAESGKTEHKPYEDKSSSTKSSKDKEKRKEIGEEIDGNSKRKKSPENGHHTDNSGVTTTNHHSSRHANKENSSEKHKSSDKGNKSVQKEHHSKHESSKDRTDRTKDEQKDKQREGSERKHATSSSSHQKKSDSKKREESHKDGHHRHNSSKETPKEKLDLKNAYEKSSKHSSSTSKDKDRSRHEHNQSKHEKSDKEKSYTKEKEKEHREKIKNSSDKDSFDNGPSTSAAALAANGADVYSSSSSKKRKHCDITENNTNDAKSPTSKIAKTKKATVTEEEEPDDGIDSSMGANFEDVLGMLNMPLKKSKKVLNNFKSSSTSSTPNKTNGSDITKESSISSSSIKVNGTKSSASKSSSKALSPEKKPDLLSSSAKLEPLDPSIALALPVITNNYKPLPFNQTVMDCVFNTEKSSASKTAIRTLTDAEALRQGISSKTIRTKIYSGFKSGQVLQVPTLFDLCIRVLQKNIDALEYTGGVPFEVLKPVLERATPQQLLIFEEYNPYLMDDSDTLWKQHVQRNYRTQRRQEMETWREMYLRCQDDQERKLNILAESIKQSQKIITAPLRKTQLAYVDSMVKPPRNVLRKQEQYGTKSKLAATPAARVAALSAMAPNAVKSGDSRLRVSSQVRDTAQAASSTVRPKKAPLMVKTLQFMRGRHKR